MTHITVKKPKNFKLYLDTSITYQKYLRLIILNHIKSIHNLFNYIVYLAITLNLIIELILIFNIIFISLYLT